MLESLATRLQKELHVPKVNVRVSKGRMPDRVSVTFDAGGDDESFDIDLGKFLYHSKQGWTGEGEAAVKMHGNKLSFGLISDADRLMERYAGIQAAFERKNLGTERVGLRFRFNSYHQQWNNTTLATALPGQLYRTRQHFIPEVTVRLAEPLELTAGLDFARYRTFFPTRLPWVGRADRILQRCGYNSALPPALGSIRNISRDRGFLWSAAVADCWKATRSSPPIQGCPLR
jgi:hypothetical protein